MTRLLRGRIQSVKPPPWRKGIQGKHLWRGAALSFARLRVNASAIQRKRRVRFWELCDATDERRCF